MKKLQAVSMVLLVFTLIIMAVNIFIIPLSDWTVRIDGIAMLISIGAVSYSTVKSVKSTSRLPKDNS